MHGQAHDEAFVLAEVLSHGVRYSIEKNFEWLQEEEGLIGAPDPDHLKYAENIVVVKQ